jgi:cytidine deaminase
MTASGPRPLDLLRAAKRVRKNSYSPYSGYKVAAALITDQGQVVAGVNVENASYGGTICAERTAIFAAVTEGMKHLCGLLVLTDAKDPWPPCGFCRQVIAEFADPSCPVWLANTKKGILIETTLGELLPGQFGPKQLKSRS